jgi:high-affinity iron transporter
MMESSRNLERLRVALASLLVSLFAALVLLPGSAVAGPEDDAGASSAIIERALAAASAGDLATALREYKAFENRWFEIEDGVRDKSREAYRAIEKYMVDAEAAMEDRKQADAVARLTDLNNELKKFATGQAATQVSASPAVAAAEAGEPTVGTLLEHLGKTRAALNAGDYATASTAFERFNDTWLDVEGEIKTRSAGDYRDTENDMARVTTGLSKSSTGLVPILDAMEARLKPYVNAGDYRPFDATIIVLREGLEALLVVVALLSFVKQSGNSDKSGFVWGGAVFGLVASIALGLVIHFTLGKAFSGEHRELMEGISGLFAAAMLLYVSYWLHSKSSLGAWHKYISERTTRALATGSLVGLGLLSFLAVFREGGETVLFLIGMTGRISTGDLTLGLAYGFVALAIVGVLLTVAGVKLPMRPFFAVASLLTFYLCFKFIGTGIHALQVADVVSATTSESLPSNDTLGLYPTWQTTIPQIVLLIAGISVAVWGRISDLSLARRTQAAADS